MFERNEARDWMPWAFALAGGLLCLLVALTLSWAQSSSDIGQSYVVNCNIGAGTLISARNPRRLKMSFQNLDTAQGITVAKAGGSFTLGENKLLSGQAGSDSNPAYTGAWYCFTASGLGSLLVGETSKP